MEDLSEADRIMNEIYNKRESILVKGHKPKTIYIDYELLYTLLNSDHAFRMAFTQDIAYNPIIMGLEVIKVDKKDHINVSE